MKTFIQSTYSIGIAMLLLLASCVGNGGSEGVDPNDLEALRAKKAELLENEHKLKAEIEDLEAKISKLDSSESFEKITVNRIKTEMFTHFVELQGNVQTKNNLVLFPEYAGQLISVPVNEGQRVSKGQVLAVIDDGGLGRQRSQIEVQVDLAKTTYEKQERLWKKNIGSEIQYLQAKTNYEAQAEALKQLDAQLEKTTIRAPFNGVVDEIISEQGSMVSPGMTQVMRIVNNSNMYVEVDVPESHLKNIKLGNKAIVEIPVLGESIESSVRFVGSFVNPANRTFKVEVAIPNESGLVKPNLNAKVRINDYINESAIMIAQSLISEDSKGKEYVYLIKDRKKNMGVSKKVFIETGLVNGDLIEVTNGLAVDHEIVVEGARAIREGQKVEIDVSKNKNAIENKEEQKS